MEKYVIGITGASGMIYARRLLEILSDLAEVHVIISDVGKDIAAHERVELEGFDAIYLEEDDLFADVASGSFLYDGMIVIPCSMKTLAAINAGFSSNLITRTADVCLNRRRKCILMPREMPYSTIHLRNMLSLSEAGATIMPLCPAFYTNPRCIDDLVDMVIARVLDHLGIEHTVGERWSGY